MGLQNAVSSVPSTPTGATTKPAPTPWPRPTGLARRLITRRVPIGSWPDAYTHQPDDIKTILNTRTDRPSRGPPRFSARSAMTPADAQPSKTSCTASRREEGEGPSRWTASGDIQNSQFGMSATSRTVIVHGVPNGGSACASSARGGSGASWALRIAGGVTAPAFASCRAGGLWPELGRPV